MKTDKIFISKLSDAKNNPESFAITGIYSLFESNNDKVFYFDGECHSPWEMVYIIEGEAGITADDSVYMVSAGDVVVHKPMEFHKIWSAGGNNLRILVCSFDFNTGVSNNFGGVYHLSGKAKDSMQQLLEFIREEFSEAPIHFPRGKSDNFEGMPFCFVEPRDENDMFYVVKYFNCIDKNKTSLQILFGMLQLLFLHMSCLDNNNKDLSQNDRMRLYTEIAGILEENIYGKITISQIAKTCKVSAATIKSCFVEFAGCGVHKYFLNIKIRAAIEMLKNGMTVNEVSDKLQFSNPNYFSYVFKRETGTSASTYKK